MVSFHRGLAGIVRQLASRGSALSSGSTAGDEQILAGLRIVGAALDRLTASRGDVLSGTSTYSSLSSLVSSPDASHLAPTNLFAGGTVGSSRGFVTGKDPEEELKIRSAQDILADLNLQASDLRRTPASSTRGKPFSGREEVPAGVASSGASYDDGDDGSSSDDDDDGRSSSGSSSSDSDDSDDELDPEDGDAKSEAARVWDAKFDEWYHKGMETLFPEPKLVSDFMYREDGERIDADSPLKVEDFWPTQRDLPKLDMPDLPSLKPHNEIPEGEPSMEEMITKMDFEGVFGLPSFQEVYAIEAWGKAEAKRQARERELEKQLAQAARRVRTVDEFGRSHAVGKRKCSVARVWLKEGQGYFTINGRMYVDYFPQMDYRLSVLQPFMETSTLGRFDIRCLVNGGGLSGQSQAIRHGISKALQLFDPVGMRPPLRSAGLLTRDPRVVERKKPGKAKARKSFQWVKR